MEGRSMVSCSTGSMNSLLDKLTKLKNRPEPIRELQQDLESLKKDLLDKFALQGATDEQVKVWMKQVREVVYDFEDWIDQKPELILWGESEVEEIEEFKAQIQEARERCTRYALIDKAPTCTGAGGGDVRSGKLVTTDSAQQLGLENRVLFGLAGQKDELSKHLMDDEHEKLKVVSIVGMGGLGKTTLAKEIHEELRWKFHCTAFVYVGGENPSERTILKNILRQIISWQESDFRDWHDEQKVIAELWKLLGRKRYFIVLDGIWSIRAWRVISSALPGNDLGSRILTTTRSKDVANSCSRGCTGVVHQMEALSKEDSEKLLSSRMSVGQEISPVGRKEYLYFSDILKMCRGMPLAIIVAAGLLGQKSAGLMMLGKSILSPLNQVMRKVLHMSYADLSEALKSCFLYLSVFPENYTIKKDLLIRLWEAEGFIPRTDRGSLWVTGENYFNELISRRLIQPVFCFDDDQAVGCTVHGAILDFIRSLSREENFATMAAELVSDPLSCGVIRRFSLGCSNKDENDTWASSMEHLSSMRSLKVFGDSEDDEDNKSPGNYRDHFLSFKLIRVLDLEETKNLKDYHLEGIGGLVLLRYLGLRATGFEQLPEEIGKLEHLETLDVRSNWLLRSLPASIVRLRSLVRLFLDGYIHIEVEQLLEMPELEEVSYIHAAHRKSLNSVSALLSKSNRLRILGVILDESLARETDLLMSFLKVVGNSGVHSLSLHYCVNDEFIGLPVDIWEKLSADPSVTSQLQRFELKIGSGVLRVPPRMASLVSLTHLHVEEFLELEVEGLRVLEGLRNLVLLNLSTVYAPEETWVIKEGAFPSLKVFSLTCLKGFPSMWLTFAEGAMPQLRSLGLGFLASSCQFGGKWDFGIQHLGCLVRVHATIYCARVTVSEVEVAEAHIRAQLSGNTNELTLELTIVNEDEMLKSNFSSFTTRALREFFGISLDQPKIPKIPKLAIYQAGRNEFSQANCPDTLHRRFTALSNCKRKLWHFYKLFL